MGHTDTGISTIDTVFMLFKTHLDLGFTDFASSVTRRYFDDYIPRALDLARVTRHDEAGERFVWTTGSWLIFEYLEQASPKARDAMDEAIAAGDIVWHGLPFTTHTELADRDLYRYGLSLSARLDKRYGKSTRSAIMTDVPGHTRGIVPLLADAGIEFLHIGVNPSVAIPHVPRAFVWQDPGGQSIVTMYSGDYGQPAIIDGTRDALYFCFTNDNCGPQDKAGVRATYRQVRETYPESVLAAGSLDAYVAKIMPYRSQLPVITSEIGDSWIHGGGTDPVKLAQLRALLRLRSKWVEDGVAAPGDEMLDAFHGGLLKVVEHTWGLDEKTHLDDYEAYSVADLAKARNSDERFSTMERSWAEQRSYIAEAVNGLLIGRLREEASDAIAQTLPVAGPAVPAGAPPAPLRICSGSLSLEVSRETGAIVSLIDTESGHEWGAQGFCQLRYEQFCADDYERFLSQYVRHLYDWALLDLTKPGIDRVVSKHTRSNARIAGAVVDDDTIRCDLAFDDTYAREIAPERITLTYRFTNNGELSVELAWFGKPACRLPEAYWLSMAPAVQADSRWVFDKLGEAVDPRDVVLRGGRWLHGIGKGVTVYGPSAALEIVSLDAALVAPGKPSLLDYDMEHEPDMSGGVHFNLYNNIYGTNFPMWYDNDSRFRFTVKAG